MAAAEIFAWLRKAIVRGQFKRETPMALLKAG
jgi:hypothetical protein